MEYFKDYVCVACGSIRLGKGYADIHASCRDCGSTNYLRNERLQEYYRIVCVCGWDSGFIDYDKNPTMMRAYRRWLIHLGKKHKLTLKDVFEGKLKVK